MTHGLLSSYQHGCRCDECRAAIRAPVIDRKAMGDLLAELFPLGLTDDCPARQKAAA